MDLLASEKYRFVFNAQMVTKAKLNGPVALNGVTGNLDLGHLSTWFRLALPSENNIYSK
jgi:hypothetical protein